MGKAENLEPVNLRIRQLGNRTFTIRPTKADSGVVFDTFIHKFHVPARTDVPQNASVIIDLGSNIGSTIAHFACTYPKAKILGVEMDSENAQLCRTNIAHWPDRCSLIEGAVWFEDGEVQYERSGYDTQSFTVASGVGSRPAGDSDYITVPAWSIDTLLHAYFPDTAIDYVKMDIEGAESKVLCRNVEWLSRVRCIKVECHEDYSVEQCLQDLRNAVLRAKVDPSHWASVIGVQLLPGRAS